MSIISVVIVIPFCIILLASMTCCFADEDVGMDAIVDVNLDTDANASNVVKNNNNDNNNDNDNNNKDEMDMNMNIDDMIEDASTSIIIEDIDDGITLFNKYTGLNTSLVASIIISKDAMLEKWSNSAHIYICVSKMNAVLTFYGVPSKSLLTTDEFVLAMLTIVITLAMYYLLMGKNHVKKRKRLAADLKIAQEKVHFLEEKLNLLQTEEILDPSGNKRQIRIFMDGAFDMMHYGHMNAFRLARSLGTYLIVGVNSDQSITQCKGKPLMNDDERLTMVRGCKFVDEVVPECPYVMNEEYLAYIIKEYKVDYVIHGDDPCIVDGKDVYESAKKAGKYQSIPRTEGVSTTDIVGRMLLMNKDHHCRRGGDGTGKDGSGADGELQREAAVVAPSPVRMTPSKGSAKNRVGLDELLCQQSKFLTTSRMLRLFSGGMKSPKDGMRIIYIDGAWDMFHPGHIALLEAAKKRGDYLIVGVHGDALVNQERGCNLPLMNLHERVLSILGCRFVDDVLIDAPQVISPVMIQSLRIDEVVYGFNGDDEISSSKKLKRYNHAMDAGIYVELPPPSPSSKNYFSFASIIERIQENQAMFQAKITRKKEAEEEFYTQKYESLPTKSSSEQQ